MLVRLLLSALLLLLLAACDSTPPVTATPGQNPTVTPGFAPEAGVSTATPLATAQVVTTPTGTESPVGEPTATVEPSQAPTQAVVPTQGASDTPLALKPAATALPGSSRIYYLDADGFTIKSMHADGTQPETLFTVAKQSDETIEDFTADPTGANLLYGMSKTQYDPVLDYYLLAHGAAQPVLVGGFVGHPQWSPDDGSRLVAQTAGASGEPDVMTIYDVRQGVTEDLDAKGQPDWFPDGKRLVYVNADNVYSYNLATHASKQLTNLPQDSNSWVVQEAHVLPDGNRIIFFGGQFKKNGEPQLGAQGNGQQWFWIPAAGGTPAPWTDAGGNGIIAYQRNGLGDKVVYVDSAHSSACVSVQSVVVVVAGGSGAGAQSLVADVPQLQELPDGSGGGDVKGVSWAPSGKRLTFGVQQYTCPADLSDRKLSAPIIFTWEIDAATGGKSAKPVKIANGYFPTWVSPAP